VSSSDELLQERFSALVDQIGEEERRPIRGWQSRVAKRLGMDRSYFAKLLSGDRQLGFAAAQSIASALRMRLAYFTDALDRVPSYLEYLEDPGESFVRTDADRRALPWSRAGSWGADLPVVSAMDPHEALVWWGELLGELESTDLLVAADALRAALVRADPVAARSAGMAFLRALSSTVSTIRRLPP